MKRGPNGPRGVASQNDSFGSGIRLSAFTSSDGFAQGPHNLVGELHAPALKTGERFVGKYRITFRGQLIANSKDAECDAARWLKAHGYSGIFKLIDGSTGKHRLSLDIEGAARLTAEEGGPRFVTWRERGRVCAPRPKTDQVHSRGKAAA